MNAAPTTTEALARSAARLLAERRASDVVVLDVRELVDYMDFLVIATGRSTRQNRALAEHLIRSLKREDELPLSRAGFEPGSWICLDFVDVVVHVFDEETRRRYDLELLWADATPLELDLPEAAPRAPDPEAPVEDADVILPPRSEEGGR